MYEQRCVYVCDGCCCFLRMMWAAGAVAAMSSITFPAISAIVSRNADPDQQGETHTTITGPSHLLNTEHKHCEIAIELISSN